MNFLNRLKFYAVGLGLGILISYFFFGNRSCNGWLPNNRVKSAILDFPFIASEQSNCLMQQHNISLDSLARFVANANINFNQSQTEVSPRIYQLSGNNSIFNIAVNFIDSVIFLKSIAQSKANCNNLSTRNTIQYDTTLRGFNELHLGNIARQNMLHYTFISSDKVTCMLNTNQFNYPKLAEFIQQADINISKSDLNSIQSEYVLNFKKNTAKVVVNHKTKEIFVKAFYGDNSTLKCEETPDKELKKMEKTIKNYLL